MSGPLVRSRLMGLKRGLGAAVHGRDLLDGKREVLLRELRAREAARDLVANEVAGLLGQARARLEAARLELGADVIDGAVLAQAPEAGLQIRHASLVGVTWPRLLLSMGSVRPCYGPADTAASLDAAVSAYAALVPIVVRLAEADTACRRLAAAFARTVRRLNALDVQVIPELAGEIDRLQAALEEEDREEAFRRKRFLAAHREA